MPEESSSPQNWKLLLIAIVIGAVVALVYNWHIDRVREASKGKTIEILAYKVNMEPGEKLKADKVTTATISADFKEGLPDVVPASEWTGVQEKAVCQSVLKDKWVMWAHFGQGTNPLTTVVQSGYIAKTIGVDPDRVPSMLLRVGCRVNLVAYLPTAPQDGRSTIKALSIIEGVRVIGIGNRAGDAAATGGQVRSITIEVHPTVAREMDNVLSYRGRGEPWLELIGADTSNTYSGNPSISKAVQHLATGASTNKAGAAPVGPGAGT